MPSILTHPAVPLALGLGLGNKVIPKPLLVAGVAASIIPDLDVIAFSLGVPYGSPLSHRGFTHSLAFAAVLALLISVFHRCLHADFPRVFWYLFVATASHGILDAFTTGGYGIAFLWPWSNERYYAPFPVIEVSPIGVARFLSARGATVLWSELLWVWLPCGFVLAVVAFLRPRIARLSR